MSLNCISYSDIKGRTDSFILDKQRKRLDRTVHVTGQCKQANGRLVLLCK